jgi:hypothetical protein
MLKHAHDGTPFEQARDPFWCRTQCRHTSLRFFLLLRFVACTLSERQWPRGMSRPTARNAGSLSSRFASQVMSNDVQSTLRHHFVCGLMHNESPNCHCMPGANSCKSLRHAVSLWHHQKLHQLCAATVSLSVVTQRRTLAPHGAEAVAPRTTPVRLHVHSQLCAPAVWPSQMLLVAQLYHTTHQVHTRNASLEVLAGLRQWRPICMHTSRCVTDHSWVCIAVL